MNIFERLKNAEDDANDFGFSWPDTNMILDQIASEVNEVRSALKDESSTRIKEEIGDLLHATLSLCVFLNFNQEEVLALTISKFEKRLSKVKELTKTQGLETLKGQHFDVLMKFWKQAKDI